MAKAMRKRRASTNTSSSSNKKPKTTRGGKRTQKQNKLFMFVDLPAELRNKIYEFAAEDETAALCPKRRGRLTSKSPLSMVSHQIRDEYLGVLCMAMGEIKALVKNFNFRHIVTFLNRLTDAELNSLSTRAHPSPRSIRFTVGINHISLETLEDLQRWLRRFQSPDVRGSNIDASYEFVSGWGIDQHHHRHLAGSSSYASPEWYWTHPRSSRSATVLRTTLGHYDTYSRAGVEATRIRQALGSWAQKPTH